MAARAWRPGTLVLVVALAGAQPARAAEVSNAELLRRIERLEQQNEALERALATERVSEQEPELVTRLKDVEFRAL
jgi:hypothetical protein